ncbi:MULTISPECIES: class I lanthipeptide [Flavobacterium]|uniref:Class I lanthipeptide n=1 Tax=Flavobacterium jumunjinense TaxID=998845 RepID=A0ABV5GR73_9FLAO|nr:MULTISPECIES: class I lanthipeptide [Flavobacterium]
MKKIQLNNGLSLNKIAITKLQDAQMSKLKGGVNRINDSISCLQLTCNTSCNNGTCNGAVLK